MFSKEKGFLVFLSLITIFFSFLGWSFGKEIALAPKTEADALRNAIEIRRFLEENLDSEKDIERVIKEAKKMGKKQQLSVAVIQSMNILEQKPQYDVKIYWELDGKLVHVANFIIKK